MPTDPFNASRCRQEMALRRSSVVLVFGLISLAALAGNPVASETALDTVVITGSLLPQSATETAAPLTVITSEEMQQRGFATVAEALQRLPMATGSVEGPQFTNGFSAAAQTLSLFGLGPGFVKYLLDGRPMSDYPALYGGANVFTSLTGIPQAMVDHIDILPGGQSSLYGSDAIAGVVNVVLKKKLDAPVVDLRYRAYQHGGGTERRVELANSFNVGGVTLLAGIQYDRSDPIWGYQRALTSSYYAAGTSPQTAERDYVAVGLLGTANGDYYFLDPNHCSNVAAQFGGTVQEYARAGRGQYCGTTRAGFYTIDHDVEATQLYLHATDQLNTHVQLYGDVLLDHEIARFTRGADSWRTDNTYYWFYEPSLGDLIFLQHTFSPEEAGGLENILNRHTTNGFRGTLGFQGTMGTSGWTFDINITHTEQRLTKRTHALWNADVTAFFDAILGPDQGPDPIFGLYPTFTPDYVRFYTPLTPAQYASMSRHVFSRSGTEDNLFRLQLTRGSLFRLPGGPVGLAVVLEGGDQGWKTVPDRALTDGEVYGYRALTGGGHRSRTAATTELRLRVLNTLTVNASTRYDQYKIGGTHVGKFTYNLGLEARPVDALLVRGRYGTAFKAASIPDEFQGPTTAYGQVIDYYQCQLDGYTGANLDNCPLVLDAAFRDNAGSFTLKPITAQVWSAGLVWAPQRRLSLSVDYLHWAISNEVATQDADQLLRIEALCRLGTYDIHSPTCLDALAKVQRDPNGLMISVNTPKINVSLESSSAVTAAIHDSLDAGRIGGFVFEAAWTDVLTHTYQKFPGDRVINLIRDPTWSTDFKTKANASLTWNRGDWTSTVYVDQYGRTPNNLASYYGYGTEGAGTLSPWTLCNASAQYQWGPNLSTSVVVNNVFDTMPPKDHSYDGTDSQPFNPFNYNIYGRAYYLELNYQIRK